MLSTLFYWLFHRHKWKDIKSGKLTYYDEENKRIIVYGTYHDQKCSECNSYREVRLGVSTC